MSGELCLNCGNDCSLCGPGFGGEGRTLLRAQIASCFAFENSRLDILVGPNSAVSRRIWVWTVSGHTSVQLLCLLCLFLELKHVSRDTKSSVFKTLTFYSFCHERQTFVGGPREVEGNVCLPVNPNKEPLCSSALGSAATMYPVHRLSVAEPAQIVTDHPFRYSLRWDREFKEVLGAVSEGAELSPREECVPAPAPAWGRHGRSPCTQGSLGPASPVGPSARGS